MLEWQRRVVKVTLCGADVCARRVLPQSDSLLRAAALQSVMAVIHSENASQQRTWERSRGRGVRGGGLGGLVSLNGWIQNTSSETKWCGGRTESEWRTLRFSYCQIRGWGWRWKRQVSAERKNWAELWHQLEVWYIFWHERHCWITVSLLSCCFEEVKLTWG